MFQFLSGLKHFLSQSLCIYIVIQPFSCPTSNKYISSMNYKSAFFPSIAGSHSKEVKRKTNKQKAKISTFVKVKRLCIRAVTVSL